MPFFFLEEIMEQEVEATEVEVAPEQAPEARSEYDLHIKSPG